ncbi:DnaJ domain-containing protein [Salicibibacter cibarius]|uniref:DnaJ domain-containing protein n=1 Tax=Salicibibacter cibarius TaxID=2743000 RepID=A0A7T6Z030_9BACI|nr:DnaJ domain-containing protein [Salicibibacter cibarius]QQK74211.1 DnaJ domain-containing protein [Salicibibacter cibarius]
MATPTVHDRVQGLTFEEMKSDISNYQSLVAESVVEIGARLKRIKEEDLTHGHFTEFLEELDIKPRQAQKMMQCADQFANAPSTADLTPGKMYEMLTLPPEIDRGEFAQGEHVVPSTGDHKTVADMTSKEMREVVKAHKPEKEAPEQPQARETIDIEPEEQAHTSQTNRELTGEEAIARLKPTFWLLLSEEVEENMTLTDLKNIAQLSHADQSMCIGDYDKYGLFPVEKYFYGISDKNYGYLMRIIEKLYKELVFSGLKDSLNERVDKLNETFQTQEEYRRELDAINAEVDEYIAEKKKERESHDDWFKSAFESGGSAGIAKSYETLGLEVGASASEVKNQYKTLMKALHPDVSKTDVTSHLFQMVKDAYDDINAQQEAAG